MKKLTALLAFVLAAIVAKSQISFLENRGNPEGKLYDTVKVVMLISYKTADVCPSYSITGYQVLKWTTSRIYNDAWFPPTWMPDSYIDINKKPLSDKIIVWQHTKL